MILRFSVERTLLLDSVLKLQRMVGSKTSMPILEGILLSAEQGKLTLIAYNLEMGMKKVLEANCEEEGDIVISARLFADILRRMNGNRITVSSDERLNCNIKCAEATFDIMGMASEDFPEIPSVPDGKSFSLKAGTLAKMVKGTFFATAQNEGAKPVFTGINVTVENGVLQFVAIDGYRLAIRREQVDLDQNFSFILTGKAILEGVRLIENEEEMIELCVSERQLAMTINGYQFTSRLLEGDFVNYQKTLPTTHKQRVVVPTKELIETIERVSLLISETFSTPVRCYFNELNVVFTCATAVGRSAEAFHTKLEGPNFEIGLNSRYLLEALKAAETEQVQILFNDSNAGVLIKPLEGDAFQYMIMPMRLR